MIQTSQAFADAVIQPSRQWRARIYCDGQDTGVTTKSIQVKGGSMGETAFALCSVYSMTLTAIVDTTDFVWENKVIEPQLGLVVDDTTDPYTVEWITLGKFTVTEPEVGKYQTTLIGVGNLASKGGLDFISPQVQSVANIVAELQTVTGLTFSVDSSFDTSTVIDKRIENLTVLEVVQIICSVLGAFASDKNDGTVIIAPYPTTVTYSVDSSRMIEEPTFAELNNTITGVHVIVQEESLDENGEVIPPIEYQTEDYNITIVNPYMTETAFTSFANRLTGLTWRKGDVKLAIGDPRLEATDLVAVTVDDTVNIPCHSFIHNFDGGLSTYITSQGDSESFAEVQQGGQVTRQLKEITADLITAKRIATEALSVADHFFVGEDGKVHVTEEPNDYTEGNNLLIDGDSVDVRQGTDTVASFGVVVSLGKYKIIGDTKLELSSSGVALKQATGSASGSITSETVLFEIGVSGRLSSYFTFGTRKRNSLIGNKSFASGQVVSASGNCSHAEGWSTTASGDYSHAEGFGGTTASGEGAHAEGGNTTASSRYAHAEGGSTNASGNYSHAEGILTTASGNYSHAQNQNTVAGHSAQTAIGRFNDNQTTTAFEIGNGTDDNNRSNAFTVDWDGSTSIALDTTAQTGTVDGDLYTAITTLGWGGDVIA